METVFMHTQVTGKQGKGTVLQEEKRKKKAESKNGAGPFLLKTSNSPPYAKTIEQHHRRPNGLDKAHTKRRVR